MSEEDIIQKRKEAAARIAPNLGRKSDKETDSEDIIQKRKEAAAQIAPNLGQKREKKADSAEADEPAMEASDNQAKVEAKQVETAVAETVTEEATIAATPQAAQEYTVQAGDSLWAIADKFYKAGAKWNKIYEANKDVIGDNPSLVRAGQVLRIPNLDE